MKAWQVSDTQNDEKGMLIIWADSVSESKTKAVELEADSFIDLKSIRCEWADDLNVLSEEDFMLEQLKRGWGFYDIIVYEDDKNIGRVDYLTTDDVEGIEKFGWADYLVNKYLNSSKYFINDEWIEK